MIVLLAVFVRSPDIGRDRRFSSHGLTSESLPSGFKSDFWQVRYTGTVVIEQIEVATSVKELQQV